MATKPSAPSGLPNASARLMEQCVEAAKRYQDVGHDFELLRKYLRSELKEPNGAARIAACMLSTSALMSALNSMLITKLSEEG
jgi:hypothetical protein